MGVPLFVGCLFIAYAPSTALVLGYASRRSALLLVTIIGAFIWLLSLFLTSIVWIAIPPLKAVHPFTLVVGVLAQEAARYLLVYGYVRSEKASERFVTRGGSRPFNDLSSGIAAGLGFGLMHTLMMYGAMMGAAQGEAAYYIDTCPQLNMFVWTAIVALFYNTLHVTLMIVAIEAYRKRSIPLMLTPFFVHITFSLLSLANDAANGCAINLPIMGCIVLGTCGLVYLLERSPEYTAKVQIRAWQLLTEGAPNTSQREVPVAPVVRSPASGPSSSGLRNRAAYGTSSSGMPAGTI